MSRSAGTTTTAAGAPDRGEAQAALARSTDAEVAVARRHRDRLVAAAHAVVASCGHHPDRGACVGAGCHLGGLPDGPAVCGVAHALAGLTSPTPVTATSSAAEAVAEFRSCLVAAADAIRHCRQAEHGAGGCWFGPAPGVDGCRAVLRLLHEAC